MLRPLELTDQAWTVVEPLLARSRMGTPVRDRRQVLNGILWKLFTGAAWRDVPERYGPWQTVHESFRQWSADGNWHRLLAHVRQGSDAIGEVDYSSVRSDSTSVGAPQRVAGAHQSVNYSDGPAAD